LSGRSSSSGEAHIYGSSYAHDASARTSFRRVEDDKFETNADRADKNSLLKWGKITSLTFILGKCCQRSEMRCLVYLHSGAKDAVFNVDSRRLVDSSKGLGNSGVETICFCLNLDTLFAAVLFMIAAKIFKAKGELKGKSKQTHGKVQGRWGRRGEKSRTRNPKLLSPFKGTANIRGFNLAFFLFLLVAGVSGVNVVDMNGLFNTVSNGGSNTGNSLMANGDTAILADGPYKCSEGTCAASDNMLYTEDLNGEVKCLEDNASCVLDGEDAKRGMNVWGTGSGTLILRALTFDKGYAIYGGGVNIGNGAIVDLELLVFSNNRATDTYYGGGAIFVQTSGTSVNAYGTSFNGNTADSGYGDDIYRNSGWGSQASITIHNTCPSPYSSNTPIQGKTRMMIV
jgi:predicted outer membrane repeat protein